VGLDESARRSAAADGRTAARLSIEPRDVKAGEPAEAKSKAVCANLGHPNVVRAIRGKRRANQRLLFGDGSKSSFAYSIGPSRII
jgi:hypothetical protein